MLLLQIEQLNSPALKIVDVSITASLQIFEVSFNDTCSSPCANLLHSIQIKESASAPQDSRTIFVTSNSGPEIEVFDESTTSGE